MNQREAADALDLSVSTISRYCSGERTPPLDVMYKIRDVMRWSVQAQADEVRCGTYAQEFTAKMESRQARRPNAEASTMRGVQSAGSGGHGVPALEAGSQTGEESRMGEGASSFCYHPR